MDEFIYDIIIVTIDEPSWVERTKKAALLVIHTIFRPLQYSELLKRDDSLSTRKLAGEGQLDKLKTCLGCYIKTRYLQVFLPKK